MPQQYINLVRWPEKMLERLGVMSFAPGKRVEVTLKPHMMRRRPGKDGMNQQQIRAKITCHAGRCDEFSFL
jgi:hypothetical protein